MYGTQTAWVTHSTSSWFENDVEQRAEPQALLFATLVLCQDLVQVKMSFSHSNLPAIPKLPVDTILQNHRVTYNRNDYEFVWYYKTFPSIQIPGGRDRFKFCVNSKTDIRFY